MTDVLIFAPAPLLTVTLEGDHPGGDLHVHSGGQGVWQARMLRTLGRTVAIVGSFTGESGRVVQHLLGDEGIEVHAVVRTGRGPASGPSSPNSPATRSRGTTSTSCTRRCSARPWPPAS